MSAFGTENNINSNRESPLRRPPRQLSSQDLGLELLSASSVTTVLIISLVIPILCFSVLICKRMDTHKNLCSLKEIKYLKYIHY